MTAEVLQYLQPERGGLFVDCTVGLGGHARALLEAGATTAPWLRSRSGRHSRARHNLAPWADRVESSTRTIARSTTVLDSRRIDQIDGALADLGVSSHAARAPKAAASASSATSRSTCAWIGPRARRRPISWPVVGARARGRHFRSTAKSAFRGGSLARSSKRVAIAPIDHDRAARVDRPAVRVPRRGYMRIDPATRTFQALRIWVNRELEGPRPLHRAGRAAAPAGARGWS